MSTSEIQEREQFEKTTKQSWHIRVCASADILNFGCSVFVRGYKVATSRVAGLWVKQQTKKELKGEGRKGGVQVSVRLGTNTLLP